MFPLLQDEMAAPETPMEALQASHSPDREMAGRPARVEEAHSPQEAKDRAAQATYSAPQAHDSPPKESAEPAGETGARQKTLGQRGGQQRPAAIRPRTVPRSIILLPEPYANWRERLVGLFRALTPDKADGRLTPGHVGQVYIQRPLSESYLVSAKYDLNVRGGGDIRWMRVVEGIVRTMRLDLQRHPITLEALPAKKTEKAACGIRVQVSLKPLSMAHSGL